MKSLAVGRTYAASTTLPTVGRILSRTPAPPVFLQIGINRGPALWPVQRRGLSLHEYQAQDLLKKAHVRVPHGEVVTTQASAKKLFERRGEAVVLKAQVLAGGRGKGVFDNGFKGGVHVVNSASDAYYIAGQMLGHRLRTKQTDDRGLMVQKLYITEKVTFEREFYLSIAVDRDSCRSILVVSRNGGMDIEKAAKDDPTSVGRVPINQGSGIGDFETFRVAGVLRLTNRIQIEQLRELLIGLYSLFESLDATLLEINPLVLTPSDELLCLDSKFNFDNAARFRHEDLFSLEDKDAGDLQEAVAAQMGFSYVKLSGNIGNIVNGAGLAMATNDAVNYFGGGCANFLDAGGKATKETFVNAIKIVLNDQRVKVIFINIYGGIIHGDMVAESLTLAVEELRPLRVPLVVRLQGTSAEKGREVLAESDLGIHVVNDFEEAIKLAVGLAATE